MDKHPGRLIEQLQSVHLRQQKVIQQLQAENNRLLTDLVELRQERDMFRAELSRSRRENSELQNRLDEATTEYQDLKRERAALLRSASVSAASLNTRGRSGSSKLSSKTRNSPSILDEGNTKSPLPTETTSTEMTTSPKPRPYVFRELPDPIGSSLKSELAPSENHVPSVGTVHSHPTSTQAGAPSPYTLHLNT